MKDPGIRKVAGPKPRPTPLPAMYADLASEPGPLLLKEMLALHGTLEAPGAANNPIIIAWADEVAKRAPNAYNRWADAFFTADSIPWCGLAIAVAAVRASQDRPERMPPDKYLAAQSWSAFGVGVAASGAMLGDVLVFTRNGGGHVGIYVGEDATHFHVLGGNQSDQVNIARIAKSRLHSVRRPIYINRPANVRKIKRAPTGKASENEA